MADMHIGKLTIRNPKEWKNDLNNGFYKVTGIAHTKNFNLTLHPRDWGFRIDWDIEAFSIQILCLSFSFYLDEHFTKEDEDDD